MAGRATSERVKTIKRRRADNAKMQAAVAAYLKELAKPEGERRKGARTVANEHSVNYRTLHDHAVGKHRPMSAYLESKQRLSAAEEHVVVDWIIESADRGIPQTHARIEAVANEILQSKNEEPSADSLESSSGYPARSGFESRGSAEMVRARQEGND
ncbi:hypothetical protein FISHEDRAFT_74076 [Fistulina hepatica ATCC 64428]|uniref:HTH CENPB-type domain-containing protein n=1 Tax=Fistulina hepatica ATCC 64428 TaxID=1128425 RepID=A0A0D7AC68_9AGAR|nr:hypothetical protein FISHEDRAFT_74076 [Fistulina hepatica ATCC 64428]